MLIGIFKNYRFTDAKYTDAIYHCYGSGYFLQGQDFLHQRIIFATTFTFSTTFAVFRPTHGRLSNAVLLNNSGLSEFC